MVNRAHSAAIAPTSHAQEAGRPGDNGRVRAGREVAAGGGAGAPGRARPRAINRQLCRMNTCAVYPLAEPIQSRNRGGPQRPARLGRTQANRAILRFKRATLMGGAAERCQGQVGSTHALLASVLDDRGIVQPMEAR